MSLWDRVVAAYARQGVPEACLQLQDEHGQNVSFLLWAYADRVADPDLLGRAVAATRAWDATALAPLRAVRRALKPPCPPVADIAREALRTEVKATELHAERVLVETLESLGRPRAEAATGLAALTAAARVE
jgi:uncharacterized protein (TIGR02444 family)